MYSESIMKSLRQRQGLDAMDTSADQELITKSKNEVFSEVCIWDGLLGGYDSVIKSWIKDIYGVDLNATR